MKASSKIRHCLTTTFNINYRKITSSVSERCSCERSTKEPINNNWRSYSRLPKLLSRLGPRHLWHLWLSPWTLRTSKSNLTERCSQTSGRKSKWTMSTFLWSATTWSHIKIWATLTKMTPSLSIILISSKKGLTMMPRRWLFKTLSWESLNLLKILTFLLQKDLTTH